MLRFSDGSTITLSAGASLGVRDIGEQGARLALDRGSAHADIMVHADTAWVIEAGPFVVKVTESACKVDWLPGRELASLRVAYDMATSVAFHAHIRYLSFFRLGLVTWPASGSARHER